MLDERLERAYLERHDPKRQSSTDAVKNKVERRFGEAGRRIVASSMESARIGAIAEQRMHIFEPGLRAFLAFVMNAPTRTEILTLTNAYNKGKGSAIHTIAGWIRALTNVASPTAVSLLDMEFELADSIPVPLADILHATIFEMMNGHAGTKLLTRVTARFAPTARKRIADIIPTLEETLRSGTLAPLFRGSTTKRATGRVRNRA
jgi:hypothetical protein